MLDLPRSVYVHRRSVNNPAIVPPARKFFLSIHELISTLKEQRRSMPQLNLVILPHLYAVCRLDPNGYIPHWALLGDDFVSLTRTREELSVVCMQENVPEEGTKAERGWRCIKVVGPFDFSVAGVHASLALPLAEAGISVLAIATFETDHVLVKEPDLEETIKTLEKAGHRFQR